MTPNELTHNATSDHENRPMAPLAAVTFTVDSSGNITGTADACADDSFAVNNAPNETYTGAIYAVHVNGNVNKTKQLVGYDSMVVGTPYTLKHHTEAHDYTITSTPPTGAAGVGPTATDNGTLRVGSGGTDDDDDDGDDDGHDSGGHQ